ncbi:MAG: hypothetical protein NXI22_25730, partial [bacterium]|nr:hypothetical protein [bacterium]
GGDRYLCVNFGRKGSEINIEGGLEMDAVAFVYDLAAASAMLVTSTIDPRVVAVLPGHRHPGIAERWPEAADVDSAESLHTWIEKEITNRRIA